MLKNPTADHLLDLHLVTMADAYLHPEPGSEALSFDDRFALLVEQEWYAKKNARIHRLVTRAAFSVNATIEDIDYRKDRNISRKDVSLLATCDFIGQHLNVILSGKTGSGKSYLACAVGATACRKGIVTRYYRLPELFAELALARLENRYVRFMQSLKKIQLLILDDIGLKPYSHDESRDLLEIAELRYNRTSTIFSSQVPHDAWYNLIPDPTIADAFMDRVVHNAYVVQLDSEKSMREIAGKKLLRSIANSVQNR